MADAKECLERGLVGALGAIPGTLAAHPLDLVKIRMQVGGGAGSGAEPFSSAFRTVLRRPLAGVRAGVTQKVLTRGPMFFLSEYSSRLAESTFDLDRTGSLFVGSFASGYATGFVAAPSEWAKVQGGLASGRGGRTTATSLASSAIRAGRLPSVLRRIHGAGLRNAIFDMTFFGTEHVLRSDFELPPAMSYAMSASLAVLIDFPLDAAVKRSMSVPGKGVVTDGPLSATTKLCRSAGRGAYAGLPAKGAEFAVSYFVTGACAPFVARAFVLVVVAVEGA